MCLLLVFVFWGGFKGQARGPEGPPPPHLALEPPYWCFFSFVFGSLPFFSFLFLEGLRVRRGGPNSFFFVFVCCVF